MRRNRACTTRASNGERNCHQIYLMSLWVALTVPNLGSEFVGYFLLHLITMKHGNKFGLYRDDGLGIIKATPRQIELIKKDLCTLFNNHGLPENYYRSEQKDRE